MSYDLVFWKQRAACLLPPSEVYRLLLDDMTPEGLEEIAVEAFLDRVREAFPGVVESGGLIFWEGGDCGMFEVHWSAHHVHFCCRELGVEEMNRLIELANDFGCALYDPQVDTRY
jgi:hypothetical protein